MKNNTIEKISLLIKLDCEALYNRIIFRKEDYLRTMVLKRTREHLKQVFRSRYYDLKLDELKEFSSEIIYSMENFYKEAEELGWYLFHTEDMPATIEEKINYHFKIIERAYEALKVSLNNSNSDPEVQEPNESDGPPVIKQTS
ncbi:MAG: hypothetical protein A2381_17825 [Bdellovibrionales bacterium RIFOXYB1_FULL_37_110]|nr:MAG: hypothetical protein A2417_08615 [Bdellovibrionales bacterium RIFOXYC1_FULL_37_79]OFZ59831.1 MAG: hypothetical protein A2381_17825 [Bdellovibrionales bacterium RIFOXYB1_FULL_37_110]OFZ65445.1 MAG: hypothetical protein A2577_18360 [Bdellovibrionales bacterium RIFOXYD1_FULL_36_51]